VEKEFFDVIILNGRPAAGKSEVIDFLKKTSVDKRIKRFHIGNFEEIDDFPILWEQFEDDDILEEMKLPRLISKKEFFYKGKKLPGYIFRDKWYWNFLIRKLDFLYKKKIRNNPKYHDDKTVIIEFSRGLEHGGFKTAYSYLSDEILRRAAIIYIDVTWEESLRKNRRRFNPDKPDSILEHGLEDLKLEMLYKESDWENIVSEDKEFVKIRDIKIPYAVFNNMPEKTLDPDKLGSHLEEITAGLWKKYRGR